MINIQHRVKVEEISKILKDKGCNFIEAEMIYQKMSLKKEEICHIIGSGWSLNHSISCIRNNDYVMGFNYAAFADLKFDMYFVELAGKAKKFETLIQFMLLKESILKYINDNLYFKNIWEDKNDIEMMVKLYKDNAFFVKDIVIDTQKTIYSRKIVDILLKKDVIYLKQTCSTSLTCILSAFFAGFNNIVLHGIDFGGPHFFDIDSFISKRETNFPRRKKIKIKYHQSDKFKVSHNTMNAAIPHSTYLKIFYERLKELDVSLYAATYKSPLSKILPVYTMLSEL
jgi:hypothetical protein